MADWERKWQDARNEILQRVDVEAEYRQMGVKITSSKPSGKGWLACKAMGREDNKPSAAINVSDDPGLRGRYRDLGGDGLSLGFFDFAAAFGPFADWKEAQRHYAKQQDVKLPGKAEQYPGHNLDFAGWIESVVRIWCKKKGGFTPEAVRLCGGTVARYPAKSVQPQYVIAFPGYGERGLDGNIACWQFAASAGQDLLLYKGEEKSPSRMKTMTSGAPDSGGLLGVHAFKHLENAERVYLMEGLTDMLALQEIIPVELRDKHVVFGHPGGALEHVKESWKVLLADKDVVLIADCDEPGQVGMKTQAKEIATFASSVKRLILPYPVVEFGGKDLRDWVLDDNTYENLEVMVEAASFETKPKEGEAKPSVKAWHEQLLELLKVNVIGEHDDMSIVVASEHYKKNSIIKKLNWFSKNDAIQMFSYDLVERYVHDGKDPIPDKYTVQQLREAIAAAAGQCRLRSDMLIGIGCWLTKLDQLVMATHGEWFGIDGECKLSRHPEPRVDDLLIDLNEPIDWLPSGPFLNYWNNEYDESFGPKIFDEAVELFDQWHWQQADAARLLVSLVPATILQAIWDWRPQILITGASHSGKSRFLEDALQFMFNGIGWFSVKPTEAAIRQHVRHNSLAILIDEFERSRDRDKILELLRVSGKGGKVYRGTPGGRVLSYQIKNIVWVAGIETGLKREADTNRWLVFDLIKKRHKVSIHVPSEYVLKDIGLRLLVATLKRFDRIKELEHSLADMEFDDVQSRMIASYAVPIAVEAAILGLTIEQAQEKLRETILSRAFGENVSEDEKDLLNEIFFSEVTLPTGRRMSVTQLIKDDSMAPLDDKAALEKVGIKMLRKHDGCRTLFLVPSVVTRHLLRGTDFEHMTIRDILKRVPGAQEGRQKMGGHTARGIEIPMDSVAALFPENSESKEDAYDSDGFV